MRLCGRFDFELVLIDGNEYTGWAEFNRVRTVCRPKYLALHDTQTLKTHKIEEYLGSHTDEYRLFLRKYAAAHSRRRLARALRRPRGRRSPRAALTRAHAVSPARYETQSTQPACQIIGCKSEDQFLPNSAGWSIYKRVDENGASSADPLAPAAVRASLRLPFDDAAPLDVRGSPRQGR